MFKIKTLNPQFEFQRDMLRHTIRDCFDFGKVVADIQVCTDICSVSFQYTFGESVINWTSDAVVPVSSVVPSCIIKEFIFSCIIMLFCHFHLH